MKPKQLGYGKGRMGAGGAPGAPRDPYGRDFVDQTEDGIGTFVRPDLSTYEGRTQRGEREGMTASRGPRDPQYLMDPFTGAEANPGGLRGGDLMDPFAAQPQSPLARAVATMPRKPPPLMDPFASAQSLDDVVGQGMPPRYDQLLDAYPNRRRR